MFLFYTRLTANLGMNKDLWSEHVTTSLCFTSVSGLRYWMTHACSSWNLIVKLSFRFKAGLAPTFMKSVTMFWNLAPWLNGATIGPEPLTSEQRTRRLLLDFSRRLVVSTMFTTFGVIFFTIFINYCLELSASVFNFTNFKLVVVFSGKSRTRVCLTNYQFFSRFIEARGFVTAWYLLSEFYGRLISLIRGWCWTFINHEPCSYSPQLSLVC